MPLHNVTVEDSSPLVNYRNISQWIDSLFTSPDYNQYSGPPDGFASNHNTSQVATVDFPFNGTSIYVFGSTGPTQGKFTVTLVPNNNFPPVTDYSLAPANAIENTTSTSFSNDKKFKQLLYSRTGLDPSVPHLISITNSGEANFILDYFIVETNYPGDASNIVEYILDDTSSAFSYSGNWSADVSSLNSSEEGRKFLGLLNNQTSHFSQQDSDQVTLKFNGSGVAIHGTWVLGTFLAKLDDQGPFRVNSSVQRPGVYNRPRELIYFADNLGEKEHTLTIVNGPLSTASLGGLSIDYAVISTTNMSSVPEGVSSTPVGQPAPSPQASGSGNGNSMTQNNGALHDAGLHGGMLATLLLVLVQFLHLVPLRRGH